MTISLVFDYYFFVYDDYWNTYSYRNHLNDVSNDNFTCYTFIFFQIPGAPDDEAVRIFLEFERVESAIKGNLYN